jgi:hypothetical protein
MGDILWDLENSEILGENTTVKSLNWESKIKSPVSFFPIKMFNIRELGYNVNKYTNLKAPQIWNSDKAAKVLNITNPPTITLY